jgi:hypothetical protein
MVRVLGLVLAVTAGLATALLLASEVSTEYDGRTVECSSVIGAAAVNAGDPPPCTGALTRRFELGALTGLLCIAGGTIVTFGGRPGQPTNAATVSTPSPGANPTRSTPPSWAR